MAILAAFVLGNPAFRFLWNYLNYGKVIEKAFSAVDGVAKKGTSLAADRTGVNQWLQNAGNLERDQLIKDTICCRVKRTSPLESPAFIINEVI